MRVEQIIGPCQLWFTAWSCPRFKEKTRFCLINESIHVLTETWNNLLEPRETQNPPQTWCLKLTTALRLHVTTTDLHAGNYRMGLLRRGEWQWLHICKLSLKTIKQLCAAVIRTCQPSVSLFYLCCFSELPLLNDFEFWKNEFSSLGFVKSVIINVIRDIQINFPTHSLFVVFENYTK